MESKGKLFVFSLEIMVAMAMMLTVGGQNTLLQETDVSSKTKLSMALASNISTLERRLNHRLRESERRITHRFEHKIRLLNQTASINHLEAILDYYFEELEASKKMNKEQAEVVRHLKTQNTHQGRELHRMKNSVERLRKTVESLNGLVEELIQTKNSGTGSNGRNRGGSTPSNDNENEVDQGHLPATKTTSVPFKPLFPTDCQYVYESGGMKYPGYYYIMIQPVISRDPFKVCCKMTNHSGWTLIQRRQDGGTDFYKNWNSYKNGFGNLEGEFWLGNEQVYQITNQGDYKLRIEMTDWDNNNYWAEYEHFRIEGEEEKYRLHVHGYHGNAGDSLTSHWQSHNGQPFSTYDQDNDDRFYDNCAEHYHGAWWFKSCFESNLNGIYYHKGSHNNYFVRNGIQWNTIHLHSSLQTVSMMVKPNDGISEDDDTVANGI